jgi:hypothetical protein
MGQSRHSGGTTQRNSDLSHPWHSQPAGRREQSAPRKGWWVVPRSGGVARGHRTLPEQEKKKGGEKSSWMATKSFGWARSVGSWEDSLITRGDRRRPNWVPTLRSRQRQVQHHRRTKQTPAARSGNHASSRCHRRRVPSNLSRPRVQEHVRTSRPQDSVPKNFGWARSVGGWTDSMVPQGYRRRTSQVPTLRGHQGSQLHHRQRDMPSACPSNSAELQVTIRWQDLEPVRPSSSPGSVPILSAGGIHCGGGGRGIEGGPRGSL